MISSSSACRAVSLARGQGEGTQQFFPAIEGAPPCPGSAAVALTNLSVTDTLAPNCQQFFMVTAAALRGTPCDYSSSKNGRSPVAQWAYISGLILGHGVSPQN